MEKSEKKKHRKSKNVEEPKEEIIETEQVDEPKLKKEKKTKKNIKESDSTIEAETQPQEDIKKEKKSKKHKHVETENAEMVEQNDEKKSSKDKEVKQEKKRVKVEETVKVEDQNLETFEIAKKVFPTESLEMFDSMTSDFSIPTPIQSRTWGATLAGGDVIGIAATGSGKTLAFVLPIVAKMLVNKGEKSPRGKVAVPRALVLAPTRELCLQTFQVAKAACDFASLGAAVAYGGAPRGEQLKSLQVTGIDFLTATPGRLKDFMESGDIDLKKCKFVVLDEADKMLEMGFEKEVRNILSVTPKTRQTLMFSATWPEEIRSIAKEFLDENAVRITLSGDKLKANVAVEQKVEVMDPRDKDRRLIDILNQNKGSRTIVFALYKKEAERVQQNLERRGFKVAGVHGDKNQAQREAAVASFTRGDVLILVATDVASRGLDIKGVTLVVNYTFPLTIADYVHRIGRTGRAGTTGSSVTFFTEHDKARAGELQNILREAGAQIPEGLLKFGNTVKKKEHALYGAHFKRDPELENTKATLVSFDSDDE